MAKYSYKGYDFEVAHEPSAEEFAQLAAHVDSLPPKEANKPGFLEKAMDTGEVDTDGLGFFGSIPALATDLVYGGAKAAVATGMGIGARAYGALTGQNDVKLNALLDASSEAVEHKAPSVGAMTGLEKEAPYRAAMKVLDPLMQAPKAAGNLATQMTGSGDVGGSVEGAMNVLGIPGLHTAGKLSAKGLFALEEKMAKPTASQAKVKSAVETAVAEREAVKAQEKETELATAKAAEEASPAYKAQQEIEARQAALERDVQEKTAPIPTEPQVKLAEVQEKAAIGEASPIEVAQAKQAAEIVPETPAPEVAVNFERKAESEQINRTLGNLIPELSRDARTADELLSLLKNEKDIAPERLYQKEGLPSFIDIPNKALGTIGNQFTKGMQFESFKHKGHSLLKTAHQWISDAVDTYTTQVRNLIDKDLAPALRNLSNTEYIELAAVLQDGMKNKVALTPESLRKAGFSENQIEAAKTMQGIKEIDFDSLNKSRAAVGKPPVDPSIGYMIGIATGNFRKLISKKTVGEDGKVSLSAVAMIGADRRNTMEARTKAFLKDNPEYVASKEIYIGVHKEGANKASSLEEAMLLLTDNSDNMAAWMEAMEAVLANDTYNSLGAAKHSKGKKGIIGMEGDKPWRSERENADDFFKAQIRGTQMMSKWAALSEAHSKLNEVLSDPWVKENHPNAVAKVKDYMDRSFGKNTTKFGAGIDYAFAKLGDATGYGPNIPKTVISGAKSLLNTMFFTINPGFWLGNVVQPQMSIPIVKSFLKNRGIDVGLDATSFSDVWATGTSSVAARYAPDELKNLLPAKAKKALTPDAFEQAMWEYGDAHGQSHAQIHSHSTRIRKDFSLEGAAYRKESLMDDQVGKAVEGGPRAVTYAAMAHMLRKAGFEKDPQIFSMAAELTNLAMVDYRPHESARFSEHFGIAGSMVKNLTSFPLHSNGLISLLAREGVKEGGSIKPFNTAILITLAYAGIQGMYGYAQIDELVTRLSGPLTGKPTTLDDLVWKIANKGDKERDSKAGSMFATGAAAWAGIDLHNVLGKNMMPGLTGGSSKFVDIGKSVGDLAEVQNDWRTQRVMQEIGGKPASMYLYNTGKLSHTTPDGKELAYNKKGDTTFEYNEEDKKAAKWGFTGTNMARQKAAEYKRSFAEDYYLKKQQGVMQTITEELASSHGKLSKEFLVKMKDKYLENEGTPEAFVQQLKAKQIALPLSVEKELLLKYSSGSLSGVKKLQRMQQ